VQELLTWLLHVGFVFNSDESAELQRKVRLMIGAAPEKKMIIQALYRTLPVHVVVNGLVESAMAWLASAPRVRIQLR